MYIFVFTINGLPHAEHRKIFHRFIFKTVNLQFDVGNE
jgi:hypothetical protein